ncbi:reverse transcriptase [Phytophthora megakarya]|uniref:Reverse transcriptase n=1 Tax=Phytophthora megakarya TaxID=4795 RepID=A0A225VND4_9STRA|nr:reverse transcriptase [Phytophthora megakarya]
MLRLDQSDLLFYCPTPKEAAADRDKLMRLMMVAIKGSIAPMIGSAIISTGEGYTRVTAICKGRPRIQGESPGNLQAKYPFLIIAMDHIPSLPGSFNGNTELLIFVDPFDTK